jgi:hypothetical protein
MRIRAKRHRTDQVGLSDATNQQAIINMGDHDTGNMCYSYEYRNIRNWGREINISNTYPKCSHGGKISLDPLSETPSPLRELLTGDTREANNFKEHTSVQLSNGIRIDGRRHQIST